MSEISSHIQTRRNKLFSFCKGMVEGEKGVDLINKYQTSIEKVTPEDTVVIVDRLVAAGFAMQDIKKTLSKILNVFYQYLNAFEWEHPSKDHFLGILMEENRLLKAKLAKLRPYIQTINKQTGKERSDATEIVRSELKAIRNFEIHYQKKENILFPYFESKFSEYKCLSVMWSIHDDIRKHQNDMDEIFSSSEFDLKKFNRSIADLFFAMHTIIFREDHILFPVAMKYVPDSDWRKMHEQSFDIGFVFVDPPNKLSMEKDEDRFFDG